MVDFEKSRQRMEEYLARVRILGESQLRNAHLKACDLFEERLEWESVPFRLMLESNRRCNVKCVHCDIERTGTGSLHPEILERLMEEVGWGSMEIMPFAGGEPTLAPIEHLAKLARRHNNYLNFITNGFLFDRSYYRSIADVTARVHFSLHSHRKEVNERIANVGRYAREATLQLAMLIIGLVVAVSLFINAKWEVEGDPDAVKDSMYSTVVRELVTRFETFYASFARVIGAQLLISLINTALTSVFLVWNGFQYATVIIVLTFLFGLLPIIGNLMSNTLIVGVAFTISPRMALFALVFLVVIHKLEYLLNAHIIGSRIRASAWELLLAMLLMESAFGLRGLIAAPVYYAYLKDELSSRGLV